MFPYQNKPPLCQQLNIPEFSYKSFSSKQPPIHQISFDSISNYEPVSKINPSSLEQIIKLRSQLTKTKSKLEAYKQMEGTYQQSINKVKGSQKQINKLKNMVFELVEIVRFKVQKLVSILVQNENRAEEEQFEQVKRYQVQDYLSNSKISKSLNNNIQSKLFNKFKMNDFSKNQNNFKTHKIYNLCNQKDHKLQPMQQFYKEQQSQKQDNLTQSRTFDQNFYSFIQYIQTNFKILEAKTKELQKRTQQLNSKYLQKQKFQLQIQVQRREQQLLIAQLQQNIKIKQLDLSKLTNQLNQLQKQNIELQQKTQEKQKLIMLKQLQCEQLQKRPLQIQNTLLQQINNLKSIYQNEQIKQNMINKIRYKCQELLDNQLGGNRQMILTNLKEEFENMARHRYESEKVESSQDERFYNRGNYWQDQRFQTFKKGGQDNKKQENRKKQKIYQNDLSLSKQMKNIKFKRIQKPEAQPSIKRLHIKQSIQQQNFQQNHKIQQTYTDTHNDKMQASYQVPLQMLKSKIPKPINKNKNKYQLVFS